MLFYNIDDFSQSPVLGFEPVNTLLLNSQRLINDGLPQLIGINLDQTASHRRLAKIHVPADLPDDQAFGPDHFNDLQLEARVKNSPF